MESSKRKPKKRNIQEEKSEVLESFVSVEDINDYVGKPYVVKDAKNIKELYLYIDYLKRSNDFLTVLCRNKERRIRNLRKGLQRYMEIGEDYIPVRVTESQMENIYEMNIPKLSKNKKKFIELSHYFISTQNYIYNQFSYNYNLNEFQFKVLCCGYLLESFDKRVIKNALFPMKGVGMKAVNDLLKPIEDMGFIKTIIGSKVTGIVIFAITNDGIDYLEKFLTALYKGKLEPFKLYDKYKNRKKEGPNSDVWKDFGFPIRPIGKAEAPINRRRRARNREQIQHES